MSTLKVDTITTISGTGNINLSRPIAGDGSNLTGVAPTKTTIEALGIDLPAANLTGTVHADRYTDTVYTHPTTAGNKHIPTAGATDQVLTYSSSGTASWAAPATGPTTQIKEIYTTFDLSSSTGTFAVTGVGFEPEFVYVMAGEHETLAFSWGFGTVGGPSKHCAVNFRKADDSRCSGVTTEIAYYWPNGSHRHLIDIDSMDSDGATFGNTKLGSPTGTFSLYMYFMRFSA